MTAMSRVTPLQEGMTMFDPKCSMQVQLDNLWLKPEDLARGLDIRVSSVRKWLDPELGCMPVKDAFDWICDQNEKLDDLTMQCLNDVNESYGKFGQYILPWYRDDDLPDTEPVGLCNLASRLVADQLEEKGIEYSFVYACRDDGWIELNLDSFPDVDLKAEFAAQADILGVPTSEIAMALGITGRSVKDWKNPKRDDMLPVDDAWDFLDDFAEKLESRTSELLESKPEPMPYHPMTRQGTLTLQERIDNQAALAASKQIMGDGNSVVDFAYA